MLICALQNQAENDMKKECYICGRENYEFESQAKVWRNSWLLHVSSVDKSQKLKQKKKSAEGSTVLFLCCRVFSITWRMITTCGLTCSSSFTWRASKRQTTQRWNCSFTNRYDRRSTRCYTCKSCFWCVPHTTTSATGTLFGMTCPFR